MSRMPLQTDVAGGLVVIGVAVVAFWQASDLRTGTLGGMGPGMLPKALAVLLALLGALLIASAVKERGRVVSSFSLRAPLFVLGAVVAFGALIRPAGLVVAGPVAILTVGFANADVRWREMIVFAIALTAFCVVLFKFALGLPMPLAPWLLGY